MGDFSVSPTAPSVAQTKAYSLQVEQTFHKVAGLESINVASNLLPLVKHDFNPESRLGCVAIWLLLFADDTQCCICFQRKIQREKRNT